MNWVRFVQFFLAGAFQREDVTVLLWFCDFNLLSKGIKYNNARFYQVLSQLRSEALKTNQRFPLSVPVMEYLMQHEKWAEVFESYISRDLFPICLDMQWPLQDSRAMAIAQWLHKTCGSRYAIFSTGPAETYDMEITDEQFYYVPREQWHEEMTIPDDWTRHPITIKR